MELELKYDHLTGLFSAYLDDFEQLVLGSKLTTTLPCSADKYDLVSSLHQVTPVCLVDDLL